MESYSYFSITFFIIVIVKKEWADLRKKIQLITNSTFFSLLTR